MPTWGGERNAYIEMPTWGHERNAYIRTPTWDRATPTWCGRASGTPVCTCWVQWGRTATLTQLGRARGTPEQRAHGTASATSTWHGEWKTYMAQRRAQLLHGAGRAERLHGPRAQRLHGAGARYLHTWLSKRGAYIHGVVSAVPTWCGAYMVQRARRLHTWRSECGAYTVRRARSRHGAALTWRSKLIVAYMARDARERSAYIVWRARCLHGAASAAPTWRSELSGAYLARCLHRAASSAAPTWYGECGAYMAQAARLHHAAERAAT